MLRSSKSSVVAKFDDHGVPTVSAAIKLSSIALVASLLLAQSSWATVRISENVTLDQKALNRHTISWVANHGQWDARAAFRAQSFAGAVWVTTDGALVHEFSGAKRATPVDGTSSPSAVAGKSRRGTGQLRHDPSTESENERNSGWVLTERFVGGRFTLPANGVDRQASNVSFRIGDVTRHVNEAASYGQVELGEVFPGVNVALKASNANVEKLFTVAPHRDPNLIRVAIGGAHSLRLGADGSLIAQTGHGDVAFTAPIAFQEVNGQRKDVVVRYTLDAKSNEYGFALAPYDQNIPITIDPLLQSTFLGGSGSEILKAIAIHPVSGDVYVAGATSSTNFPGTIGGAQTSSAGAFVSRFNATLTARLQSTYLGGSFSTVANALAIHPTSGDVYVAGETQSADFPSTIGGAQPSNGGAAFTYDVFVSRFNAALTTLVQSTYLGGSGTDSGVALAIHPSSGDVYVAGTTTLGAFPGTPGGAQPEGGAGVNAFVSRFNSALTTRLQSTFHAGSGDDNATSLAIHPASGDVYIAGYSSSTNFAGTSGGAQAASGGGSFDAFIGRYNAALTTRLQSTYLGGSASDIVNAIAIHPGSGEVYVAGQTLSSALPAATGGAQPSYGGNADAFATRFNAALTTILQSTYLGATSGDVANALAIHPSTGEIYLAGFTNSFDFPGTELPTRGAQSTNGGERDAFLARFNASLTTRFQSSYLGGGLNDDASALVISALSGDVYVAGTTSSTTFPGTAGGAETANSGSPDAFISRFSPELRECSLDVDGDGVVRSYVDGLLILRNMLGLTGLAFTNGVSFSAGATRTTTASIKTFIGAQRFDIDGSSGSDNAATDGVLMLRAMLGFTGDTVTASAIGAGASRGTWASVRTFLNTTCGTNFAP
jgi:hypothetical protein